MADLFPPSGIDRATGTTYDQYGIPIGTPTPQNSVAYISSNPPIFEEFPDSPEIERAEQGTIQHRFRVDPQFGLAMLQGLGRGRYLTDSAGNVTRVLSSRLNWQKPNVPVLTVTAESVSFDTPPDEFRIEVVELNPPIEKHPRYAFLPAVIRTFINQAITGAQIQTQADALKVLNDVIPSFAQPDSSGNPTVQPPNGGTWQQVQQAANELLLKKRIGEETFYLPGFRVTWAQYYFMPQFLNPGGYIGDPIDEGLPYFFWSTDGTPEGQNIFSVMKLIEPQYYSQGISWLRMADTVEFNRTWHKITHSWHGAPYAHWDSDIYSLADSPYPPPPIRFIA